ncbi:hypothetical protein TNCV_1176541 [Trichonephila clavipes]|nr:hypothetical protein TNCV_1176541 [Trichonephila clavipes]
MGPYQNSLGVLFKNESPVSGTAVTHVRAPVAWGPRIIDTADTGVATPLFPSNHLDRLISRECSGVDLPSTFSRSLTSLKCVGKTSASARSLVSLSTRNRGKTTLLCHVRRSGLGLGLPTVSLFHTTGYISGLLKTNHRIGTSAHTPQRPMVTYTETGTVGLGLHGLLRL